MARKTKNIWVEICRIVLGLTFVFSGFVKCIDPWGTALKIGDYLSIWGAGQMPDGVRIGLAIAACAAELTLGLMLVFRVKPRLTSIAALAVMVFFLIVTFLSATVLPVEDCGCFGDAVHLSPWASFGKNVVLFAFAVALWLNVRRRREKILPITAREWTVTAVFAALSVGLGVFCYRHLPLMDFLPFKKGVNLYEAKYGEGRGAESDISLMQFTVFNSAGDATHDVLSYEGRVYLLCAAKLDMIKPACAEKFEKIVRRADEEGTKVVLLTSSPISDGETATFGTATPVEVYNADQSTMITMLRARVGIVILENGIIVDKKNCRDIKYAR